MAYDEEVYEQLLKNFELGTAPSPGLRSPRSGSRSSPFRRLPNNRTAINKTAPHPGIPASAVCFSARETRSGHPWVVST